MSEETKCFVALSTAIGLVPNECTDIQDFITHFGVNIFGLSYNEIPDKRNCRLALMRSLSKRNYKQILVYVLCVLMRELEAGKNFNEAVMLAWGEVKGKIGE